MRRKASISGLTSTKSNSKVFGLTVPSFRALLLPWVRVTVLSFKSGMADSWDGVILWRSFYAKGRRHVEDESCKVPPPLASRAPPPQAGEENRRLLRVFLPCKRGRCRARKHFSCEAKGALFAASCSGVGIDAMIASPWKEIVL